MGIVESTALIVESEADLPQLSEAEAEERLRRDGPNTLELDAPPGLLASALQVVRQPMFLLLLAAGALYLVLGETRDALTLLAFVVGVMALTLYQERRSERAVAELRDLSAPTAEVLRGGARRSVPARELVVGDLVQLREGARVPADGVVLAAHNLRVDESLLTGESVPVDKLAAPPTAPFAPPGNDDSGSVYGSTLVVAGGGYAQLRATGSRSAVGAIGTALAEAKPQKSALAQEVDRMVKRIALLGGGLCALLVLAQGLLQGDYLRGLLSGITLAMAILPEEFPVVLTVFTTLGAFRVAKLGVLARRPDTLESLGSARVLCVDKTGTITENHMRVAELCAPGAAPFSVPRAGPMALPEQVHGVLEFAALASGDRTGEPMERALTDLLGSALAGSVHVHTDYTREAEYPLSRALLAVSHLFRAEGAEGHVVAAKGAPEAILDLCHLAGDAAAAVMRDVNAMASRGLRVLGVARARFEGEQHPANQHDFDFDFVGLVGFEDPVRASVPAAVQAFKEAGVRVVMITGDHAATARAIAEQAGLDVSQGVLTGAELSALSPAARAEAVTRINVFARATPEHKLTLVRAFAANGDLVAMTGDGVNDAPALKAAHIGIALGLHGTDVAREAASLVLTTEDFGSIAGAIMLGRRIFENLKRAMLFVIAVHVPIAGLALLPVLLGLPGLLFPVHVMFLELIIDPACTVALEAEEPDLASLRRPSRAGGGALFDRKSLTASVVQGAALFLGVLGLYVALLRTGTAVDEARAAAFVALVVGNVALITVARSATRSALATLVHARNRVASLISVAALGALGLVLAVAPLRTPFHFAVPASAVLLGAVAVGLGSVLWYDLVKGRRRAG
jgi:P-type Ca2+ transporter type 2C